MKDDLNALTLKAIQSIVGTKQVDLHSPSFTGNEVHYLKECIDQGYVSSIGQFVEEFESQLAKYTGAKYAVATVNGTAALHISLKIIGVGHNDEVLIPSLSFVATANAVLYCQAVPHFVDSSRQTLGIDTDLLTRYLKTTTEIRNGSCINKTTGRTIRAIVPMHTYGHPVDIEKLLKLAHDFRLTVVEDAAESLGSMYNNQHVGTFGATGALSFNGNKIVTTGGGGAILTNSRNHAETARHITTTAKIPHSWDYSHDVMGYNYRMPNLNAALGCAQLENLPTFLVAKRHLHQRYIKAFQNINNLTIFTEPPYAKSNYWMQLLIMEQSMRDRRNKLLEFLNNNNVRARPTWRLLHKLAYLNHHPRMPIINASVLENSIINIPSGVDVLQSQTAISA